MHFTPSTIAAVAGFLASVSAAPSNTHERSDVSLAPRGLFDFWWSYSSNTNLCYKPNYGANGKPWDDWSVPGAFCGTKKPRNDGQWKDIVIWDGGDSIKCNNWLSKWGLNICTGGNYRKPLPWNCKPPKKNNPKPKPSASSVVPSTTSSADPSVPSDDPYKDPVCSSTYQQMYDNYQTVAPHGIWAGQLTGASTQDNENYMSFTLATNPLDCLKACDEMEGCVFVNTYIDYDPLRPNDAKHQPGVYTCAMYKACPGLETNTNYGGQDPGAKIIDSDGWCKSGACGGR